MTRSRHSFESATPDQRNKWCSVCCPTVRRVREHQVFKRALTTSWSRARCEHRARNHTSPNWLNIPVDGVIGLSTSHAASLWLSPSMIPPTSRAPATMFTSHLYKCRQLLSRTGGADGRGGLFRHSQHPFTPRAVAVKPRQVRGTRTVRRSRLAPSGQAPSTGACLDSPSSPDCPTPSTRNWKTTSPPAVADRNGCGW
jgi:hypothetical protein